MTVPLAAVVLTSVRRISQKSLRGGVALAVYSRNSAQPRSAILSVVSGRAFWSLGSTMHPLCTGAGSWEAEWAEGYAGGSGVKVDPHALVLYQDKASAAMDAHAKEKKIKKGRKKPKRILKDAAAYKHGKRDAETVALGTKKLKTAA
jgi:hypothetical protein